MNAIRFEVAVTNLKIIHTDGSWTETHFKWPIAEVVGLGEFLVVRTQPDIGSCDNQNVAAVNSLGIRVWTIAKRKHVYGDSPYTKIMEKKGMLKLFNWDGLNVLVDPQSWTEIYAQYGK
jgi:hypothetical protein